MGALAMLWFAVALVTGFMSPTRAASEAARILYLMVPIGWVSVLGLVAVFLCSAAYLGTGTGTWDHVAHAAAEVALLFAIIAGIQNLLLEWATSGGWAGLEVRAVSYLVFALAALSYLVARGVTRERRRAQRLAATFGCGGFLVAGVVLAWYGGLRSLRPRGETAALEEVPALSVLWLCALAVVAVFVWLLGERVNSLERADGARHVR